MLDILWSFSLRKLMWVIIKILKYLNSHFFATYFEKQLQSTIKVNLIYISILFFLDAGIFVFLSFNQPILFLTNAGFIKSYFDSFYNEEIITEESFNAWESGGEEEQGKGVTIVTSSEFFATKC